MPRPLELVVEPYPVLSPGKPYPMGIAAVRKETAGLRVVLEHLASDQAGRQHEVALSLPIRPRNQTANLFTALGFGTDVGSRIDPRAAIGRQVRVTFCQEGENHDPQPVSFAPMKEETNGNAE